MRKCSGIDVDTALAVLPLGRTAGKASCWINPDNLVETHTILQFTRQWRPAVSAAFTGASPSSRSSRKSSINGRSAGVGALTEDDIGVIICDDLQRFVKRRSGATVSDSENISGKAIGKAAASIRFVFKGDTMVVVGTSADESRGSSAAGTGPVVQKARFKRKLLRDLFDIDTDMSLARIKSGLSGLIGFTEIDRMQSTDALRTWIINHSEVQPLVQVLFKRSRFVGLGNSELGAVWAPPFPCPKEERIS